MVTTAVLIVLRVSVLLAAAALVAALLRRSAAATRHLVWTCALAGSLLVPILSLVVPAWELPFLPAIPSSRVEGVIQAASARAASGSEAHSPLSHVAALPAGDRPSASARGASSLVQRPVVRANAADAMQRPGGSRDSLSGRISQRMPSWPVTVWLAGLFFVIGRLALGTARMWWVSRRARQVMSGGWLRLAGRLAHALGVARRVVFLEGSAVAMPMTWGIWRSRVLLPKDAESWPSARQRVVLLHELAHVKRRDCLTQLVAQMACAVYWFNPLVWLAAARLRAEREHACDDLVLAAGTRGSDYADHLLEIARSLRSAMAPTWAAVAMAHRSQLEGRLMAILDPRIPRRFPTRRRTLGLVAGMGVLVLPIAVMTPAPRAAEVPLVDAADSSRQPLQSASPAATPRPAPLPHPLSTAVPASSSDDHITSIVGEAIRDAVPDATKDLVREGWLPPIAQATVAAIVNGVAQGVTQGVTGGITGGVKGGVSGGISGMPGQEKGDDAARGARRDPRVVAALVEALKDSDKQVRESAMQALASMRAPEAVDAIRAALKDTNPSVREQAAFALGQYRDRGSVDALAGALQDSSADVREQAVFALGQIRDPRAVPAVVTALKDSSADVREQAAFALGQVRSPEAVDPLVASLRDSSADVREQSAFALGQIRDRRAVDGLITALKDDNASVREQAAFALGQLRDPRAIDALTAALKDPNADVRQHAAFALGQLSR